MRQFSVTPDATDRIPALERPLRIGMLSYRSNPHCGGQGVYLRHLSRALRDLGHQVEVVSGRPILFASPARMNSKIPPTCTSGSTSPPWGFRNPSFSAPGRSPF